MKESDERLRGGRPRFVQWQPRRSLSPVERYTGRDRGPAWVAENEGHMGDWFVVRSRKRKVMSKTANGRFYRSSKKSIVLTGSYEFN